VVTILKIGSEKMNFILASSSERRRELLKRIINDFEVIPSNFDEGKIIFNGDCASYVKELSEEKALNVANKVDNNNTIIIASDTVVYFNNKVLGKPQNEQDAYNMLSSLRNNVHQVYTGIAIYHTGEKKIVLGCEYTDVKFSNISDETIKKYIMTKEPMDKAGAYGIQGYGAIFVEKINGCYYNVVGLPLNRLYFMLNEMGVDL